jgi:hypothetical protein
MITREGTDLYEIPLAVVTVDDSGNITMRDARRFVHSYQRRRKILAPGPVTGGSATREFLYGGKNPVVRFPTNQDSIAGWTADISDWTEDESINVRFQVLDAYATSSSTDDTLWHLYASQWRCTDGETANYFNEEIFDVLEAGSGSGTCKMHILEFTLTVHAGDTGFYNDCPISLSLQREGTHENDTNTDDWILVGSWLEYNA